MDISWNVVCVVLVVVVFPGCVHGITTDYLNTACNVSSRALSSSQRLESSTRLYYSANTACFYHVIAGAGQQVLLLIRNFKLEAQVSGSCVDFVNIHDGSDTSAVTLNASPLCGTTVADNFTATSNEMTIYFQSDSTGQSQGFDFIFVAITTGTCSSTQLSCVNTSICIDSSLQCNTVDECGDNTDENNCVCKSTGQLVCCHLLYTSISRGQYATKTTVDTDSNAGLIAGAIIGGFIFLIVCIAVGSKLWKYYRWRLFQAKPIKARDIQFEPTTYNTTYPVTRVYYKEKFQNMYLDPRKVDTKPNRESTSGTDPIESTSVIDHVTSTSATSSTKIEERSGVQNSGYDSFSD